MVKIREDCAAHGPAADLEPSHACMMMQRVTRNSSNPGQLKQQRKTRLNINFEATQGNKRDKKRPHQTACTENAGVFRSGGTEL